MENYILAYMRDVLLTESVVYIVVSFICMKVSDTILCTWSQRITYSIGCIPERRFHLSVIILNSRSQIAKGSLYECK